MTLPATEDNKKAPAGMPPWLLAQIETKTGGLRGARWHRCKTCQELILRGLDADLCAVIVDVDPTPLTPQQELWCALQGRRTYELAQLGRKVTIWARCPYAIARPADYKIGPAHQCGMRYPGFLFTKPAPASTDQTPPF